MVGYTVINNEITLNGIRGLTNETLPHRHHTQSISEVSIPEEPMCGQRVTNFLPFTEETHWKG